MKIKAILTKPLDGDPEGAEREFEQADFDMLKGMGAVRAASDLGEDGPAPAEKAATAPANKKAPAVANKADKG